MQDVFSTFKSRLIGHGKSGLTRVRRDAAESNHAKFGFSRQKLHQIEKPQPYEKSIEYEKKKKKQQLSGKKYRSINFQANAVIMGELRAA